MKVLKGPVYLLERRRINFPASLPQAFPTTPSSYHANRRCNTREEARSAGMGTSLPNLLLLPVTSGLRAMS